MKKFINKLFKRKVNIFSIMSFLKPFAKDNDTPTIIHFDVTRTGVVNLYTNKPGLIIGKGGKDIDQLKIDLKRECNVKDVKVFEMKHMVSNFEIF